MIFDVYFPVCNLNGKRIPSTTPTKMEWAKIVELSKTPGVIDLIDKFRLGEKDCKTALPAVCYTGYCKDKRSASAMTPTQAVMIDIDHVDNPREAYEEVMSQRDKDWWQQNVLICHITPSGHGLRFVFWAQPQYYTLQGNMDAFVENFNLTKYGKYDEVCKDFSRLSFMFKRDDLLFENAQLYLVGEKFAKYGDVLVNEFQNQDENKQTDENKKNVAYPNDYTDDEKKALDEYDYNGTPVKAIIEKYVEVQGTPSKGSVHNFYNELVKNFRNICDNNKRVLFYLLPRFGHTPDECWSQITSICRTNTLSQLPKDFYYFMRQNGYYKRKLTSDFATYMMEDAPIEEDTTMPPLPPVFRELVGIAPKDFKVSAVNALLPIMGTLTSFLESKYYYDNRMHTTSFFSIIYAPAGTGKGFAERYIDMLFETIRLRDYIQTARENVYLSTISRKGANDKAPEPPHTSLRIIPSKNSEAELLQKMADNHGYHMFTYAAEMDSWAKGVKAAGGNKDDMLRIAWDNGRYGQKFKSGNTFNGEVNLYWNVLISGTIQQVENYFKNVENGLITRCSFTTIPNQEFAEAPVWRELNKKSRVVIKKFINRCDESTYTEPCNLLPEDVECVKDDDFDSQIDWRFQFRPRKEVDMGWLRKTIDEFLELQRKKASLDVDHARDVFRRRTAVRGFRLGMICTTLWAAPTKKQLESCIPFIKWWMNVDLEASLDLWGARYNNATEEIPNLAQRNIYTSLPQNFSKSDVYQLCAKQGVKTPVRMIIHQWRKINAIQELAKNEYQKNMKE